MVNGVIEGVTVETGVAAGRVLVFSVDDGLFSLQLDWVEEVYPREGAEVHIAKTRGGRAQPFLVHRNDPALILDLRELFGLAGVLGETERGAFLVVRSGSHLVALQVDACIGVRELDLRGRTPVESNLVSESGLCVGHLVEQDGGILAVLDPNRLLDGALRDALEPALREARAFIDRQQKLDGVWRELCESPTAAVVRAYARLAKRVGRPKAANAAKAVLKVMEGGDGPAPAGETVGERLVRELIRQATERRSGEVIFEREDGGVEGKIFLANGRAVDAYHQRDWGRRALRKLMELRDGRYRFAETSVENRPVRMTENTVALLIGTLESISEERRGRREK